MHSFVFFQFSQSEYIQSFFFCSILRRLSSEEDLRAQTNLRLRVVVRHPQGRLLPHLVRELPEGEEA